MMIEEYSKLLDVLPSVISVLQIFLNYFLSILGKQNTMETRYRNIPGNSYIAVQKNHSHADLIILALPVMVKYKDSII